MLQILSQIFDIFLSCFEDLLIVIFYILVICDHFTVFYLDLLGELVYKLVFFLKLLNEILHFLLESVFYFF